MIITLERIKAKAVYILFLPLTIYILTICEIIYLQFRGILYSHVLSYR